LKNKKQVRAAFRKAVFTRAKYCCQKCGMKGVDRQETEEGEPLDAHHVLGRSHFENGGYVKENGISLCTSCHEKAEKFHRTGGKEWEPGYHPNDLYKIIGSSADKAHAADTKVKEKG
jgi:predicted restriction endonuclease